MQSKSRPCYVERKAAEYEDIVQPRFCQRLIECLALILSRTLGFVKVQGSSNRMIPYFVSI